MSFTEPPDFDVPIPSCVLKRAIGMIKNRKARHIAESDREDLIAIIEHRIGTAEDLHQQGQELSWH